RAPLAAAGVKRGSARATFASTRFTRGSARLAAASSSEHLVQRLDHGFSRRGERRDESGEHADEERKEEPVDDHRRRDDEVAERAEGVAPAGNDAEAPRQSNREKDSRRPGRDREQGGLGEKRAEDQAAAEADRLQDRELPGALPNPHRGRVRSD